MTFDNLWLVEWRTAQTRKKKGIAFLLHTGCKQHGIVCKLETRQEVKQIQEYSQFSAKPA